jgi:hypothetical protein
VCKREREPIHIYRVMDNTYWAVEQRHEGNLVPWGGRDTVVMERKTLKREAQDGVRLAGRNEREQTFNS